MATAEFSKFAGILSAALSQHHLSGFEIAQLEFEIAHFMANRWGNNGNSDRLYFLGLQNHADCECSHEIKRRLLLGRKVMTNLESILKRGGKNTEKCTKKIFMTQIITMV